MKDEKIPNPLAEEPVKTDATRSFTIKVPEIHIPKVDLNRVRESWNGSKIKGGIDSAGASVKSFARAHQPKVTGLNGEQVAMDEYLIRKATEFKAETQFKAGVAATKAKVEARNRLDRAERRAKARAQKHVDDVDAYYATQRATMEKVL